MFFVDFLVQPSIRDVYCKASCRSYLRPSSPPQRRASAHRFASTKLLPLHTRTLHHHAVFRTHQPVLPPPPRPHLARPCKPPTDKTSGGKKGCKAQPQAQGQASITKDIKNFETMLAGLSLGTSVSAIGARTSAGRGGDGAGDDAHGTTSGVIADLRQPPPTPPPHPIFGSPEGKSGGGGRGGRLVEALRPLISGNARSWLVVSVGGTGKGGAGAAWRALDVARRATSFCTTCIRLR